jgi:two-component system response regulator HupR/HoxA
VKLRKDSGENLHLESESNGTQVAASNLVEEAWNQPPSESEDGAALYHGLEGASFLAKGTDSPTKPPAQDWDKFLELLIRLFGAERAFLFVAEDLDEDEEITPGVVFTDCLGSRNFDGEEISQPEDKVPHGLLSAVGLERAPVATTLELARSRPAAGYGCNESAVECVAMPIGADSRAVLYAENRFRPLQVDRNTLRIAKLYAAQLAGVLQLTRLQAETEALWHDITRIREASPARVLGPNGVKKSDRSKRAKPVERGDLTGDYSMIVGSSSRMIEIFQVLDRISSSNAPVLINGESGTGKELIAQAVHENSPRGSKVFVSENCGALTETLLESELFGYVRGAFTGATKDHKGLFELAIGGTLFLDEVGDMSAGMQKKLLRVLQEGVIRRVGGKDYVTVDVRILSATNKHLLEEVKLGNFREDLYYRLNVINLKLPPLRDRKEDIPAVVEFFLDGLSRDNGIEKAVEPATFDIIMNYNWPGNIRELQNEVRRMYALSDETVRPQDLSDTIRAGNTDDFPLQNLERELSGLTLKQATERLEKEMIRNALTECRGNKSLVAKMLQVPKTSLYNKINKYGIEKG